MRTFRRVLITGASGSAGSYMADYIFDDQPGVAVHGLSRWHQNRKLDNRVIWHECDLLDLSSIMRALRASQPDAIIHLASHANVRTGFDTPLAVLHNNIMGTANLFEAVRGTEGNPLILMCSTSEVYGQVSPDNIPITEACPINPSSPYAVSKAAQDMLAQTYFKAYGLDIIVTRMFTYINPRRDDLFASAFAKQIVAIERGTQSELRHGNLSSIRTIIDVRDAMRAYWSILELGQIGEIYNIAGLWEVTVGVFMEHLIMQSGVEVPCRLDGSLLRPFDVTMQIVNCEKFVARTGWKPKYSLDDSVSMLLGYWRNHA